MRAGKANLEESANIVEEVSFELKTKDKQIEKLKKRLNDVVKLFKGSDSKESYE